MTFFSRCDVVQGIEPSRRRLAPAQARAGSRGGTWRRSLSDFAEDVGILARYAAGLDYYDRDRMKKTG